MKKTVITIIAVLFHFSCQADTITSYKNSNGRTVYTNSGTSSYQEERPSFGQNTKENDCDDEMLTDSNEMSALNYCQRIFATCINEIVLKSYFCPSLNKEYLTCSNQCEKTYLPNREGRTVEAVNMFNVCDKSCSDQTGSLTLNDFANSFAKCKEIASHCQ